MILATVKRGNNGQLVRHLQDLLNRNGKKVTIDGSFGPATETALKQVQTELGIPADGIVTDAVWNVISKRIVTEGRVCKTPMITQHLIPITRNKRSGRAMESVEWVTAHNTANENSTAIGERGWMLNPNNDRIASWHYAVDQIHALLAIPDNEVAWHASDSTGNNTSIGVESCESGDLRKVWDNTVGLIAHLLFIHQLDIGRLTTHNRWSGKDCPRLLLPKWLQFVADVSATLNYMHAMNNVVEEPVEEPVVVEEPIEEIEEPVVIEEPVIVEDPPVEDVVPEEPVGDDKLDMTLLNRILLIIEKLLTWLIGRI